LRLARLDEFDVDTVAAYPRHQGGTNVFRPVIAPYPPVRAKA
jgi:hypothetical protein